MVDYKFEPNDAMPLSLLAVSSATVPVPVPVRTLNDKVPVLICGPGHQVSLEGVTITHCVRK